MNHIPEAGSRRANFAVVHNIPSPYRLHLFRGLSAALDRVGIGLTVHFMAAGHADRTHWGDYDLGSEPFSAKIWRDSGPMIGSMGGHLNLGLLSHLARNPPEYLMLGGVWASLTCLLGAVGPFSRSKKIAWLEPNTKTKGYAQGAKATVKRLLLQRFDVIAVPGSDGAKFVSDLFAAVAKPDVVVLPNLVDERLFVPAESDEVRCASKRALGLDPSRPVAFCNARLIPVKGLIEFFSTISRQDIGDWQVIVIGEGPLKSALHAVLENRGLSGNVSVRDSVPYHAMPATYRAADLFLLPSLRDQNPLSVIEAMHSALPLLVSSRIGNFPEAVRDLENGWSFDPADEPQVRRAVKAALASPIEKLRAMGRESRAMANHHWSTASALSRFVAEVTCSSASRSPITE